MAIPHFVSVMEVLGEKFLTRTSTTVEVMQEALRRRGFPHQFTHVGERDPYGFINSVHSGDVELHDRWTVAAGVMAFSDERDAVLARLIISD